MIREPRTTRSSRGTSGRPASTWTVLAQSESVFALSNGHIGLRGNLDEGEPHGLPGTYLNSFYELRPLPYAEAGYGYPESGQTIVNVTNGKLIRLLVDDEPFDVRYGELRSHERVLDLRAGTLRPRASSGARRPAGGCGCARTRLVSFTQRAVAAIRYEVEPVDGPAAARSCSPSWSPTRQLPPQRRRPAGGRGAGAAAGGRGAPGARRRGALLVHHTKRSGLRMAAGDGPRRSTARTGPTCAPRRTPDWARTTVACVLRARRAAAAGQVPRRTAGPAGARCRRCATRSRAALTGARLHRLGRPAAREQREYLDDVLGRAPTSRSRATRRCSRRSGSALFHVLQAGARAEQRPIPAKGLTGPGYDGHVFWDTETFVLPVLTYTAARRRSAHALRWRHSTLTWPGSGPSTLGLRGAAFPWRTIRGAGVLGATGRPAPPRSTSTPTSPTPCVRYVDATGDEDFERDVGAGAAGGDGPAVALARPPRPARRVPHRRGHRPGRVHRGRRRQRLHQPDGAAEPARRGRRRRAPPGRGPPARRRRRGDGRLAGRGRRRCTSRTTRSSACTSSPRASPGYEEWDFARHAAGARTRCCCTSRTSTCTASRWSSRPTWCWRCTGAATRSPPRRRRATSPTTSALHGARLVAVGVHPGGARRRGRPPRAGLRLPRARPR